MALDPPVFWLEVVANAIRTEKFPQECSYEENISKPETA